MGAFKDSFQTARQRARRSSSGFVISVCVLAGIVQLVLFRSLEARYLVAMGVFYFLLLPAFGVWWNKRRS